MGLIKQLGQTTGKITGSVLEKTLDTAATMTKNNDLHELGKVAKAGHEVKGAFLGQTTEGVWNIATGLIKKDNSRVTAGKVALQASSAYAAESVTEAAIFIGDQVVDTVDGVIEKDSQKLKQVAKKSTKAVITSLIVF